MLLVMLDLTRSVDDECIECANADVIPPPRPVDHEIEQFEAFFSCPYQPSRHETEQMQVIVEQLFGQGSSDLVRLPVLL
jgi:hypothetical protein